MTTFAGMSNVNVTYVGTATAIIEVEGLRLITDPVLGPQGRTVSFAPLAKSTHLVAPALAGVDLEDIDLVLLSHDQHEDNLDAEGRALLRRVSRTLTTRAGAKRLGGNAEGLSPGDRIDVATDEGEVTITATPAQHGPRWLVQLAGDVIGFHVACDGGSIWITGDTVYTAEVAEAGACLGVDVLMPHLGAARLAPTGPIRYTMDAREGARLARDVGARRVVPVHYEGWSHFSEGRVEVERVFASVDVGLQWLPAGKPVALG